MPREKLLFVVLLVVACSGSAFAGEGEPDAKAVVQSYRAFYPRFIAIYTKMGYKNPEQVKVIVFGTKYDVKKTDSLVTPIVGFLSFKSADSPEDKTFNQREFTFSFEDGKWSVLTEKHQIQDVGEPEHPLIEESSPREDTRKATDQANAPVDKKPK